MDVGLHYAATPPSDSVSKSLQMVAILDSEGIHQSIYIVAEHKVIFLSEERHQLLMTTAKRRNSDSFLEKIPTFKSDPSNSALL